MAITTLLDPTLLPARTMDQAQFDAAMAYLMTNLPTWGAQTNAIQSNLNTIAAGGAYAIAYKFSASTAAIGDAPGGILAFQDGYNASSTGYVYLDTKDLSGNADTALLNSTVSGNASTIKGHIRLVKQGDPTAWARYSVTSFTLYGTGFYGYFGVTPIDASSANPFAANDTVLLFFQRTGDKGDAGSLTSVLWVRDEKASGSTGGSAAASGYTTRTLNTIKKNSISGASVAGNQITLPAGTYRAAFSAPGYNVNGHQAYLYNVTDAAITVLGTTATAGTGIQNRSEAINSEFVIAASKVFEIRHWTTTSTASTGLGYMASTGQNEVFTDVFIEKVS